VDGHGRNQIADGEGGNKAVQPQIAQAQGGILDWD
jgi:hypothetical protein